MMTQLYPVAPVAAKSSRSTTTRRFGQGVLPTYPSYRADHTVSDSQWLLNDELAREERAMEQAERDRILERHAQYDELERRMDLDAAEADFRDQYEQVGYASC